MAIPLSQDALLDAPPAVRFAPSPNGHMHLGHAYAAIFAYRAAKAIGAKFLIRMEDIDTLRCNRMYGDEMLEDLEWLGIEWDEPPIWQSERLVHYKTAFRRLMDMNVLFPSVLSRQELSNLAFAKEGETGKPAQRDPDGSLIYPGDEHMLTKAEQRNMFMHPEGCALRLNMGAALDKLDNFGLTPRDLIWTEIGVGPKGETARTTAHPEDWGDVVLKRRDLETSYHMSVVVDDAVQHITHVIRGQDMFYATSLHRLLQVLLGYPTPVYCHHPLVLDEEGRKLSKSDRDISIRSLRENGWTAEKIISEINVPEMPM